MRQILAAIDFTPVSTLVTENAAAIATAFTSELTLIHVAAPEPDFVGYEPGPQTERDARAHELRFAHRQLQTLANAVSARGVRARSLLVRGATPDGIIAEAERIGADLIVVGSHGKATLSKVWLGSVSEGVLRRSPCPVLIIPTRTLKHNR
jgi:nucleotide-binding universal stress UspA family protein